MDVLNFYPSGTLFEESSNSGVDCVTGRSVPRYGSDPSA